MTARSAISCPWSKPSPAACSERSRRSPISTSPTRTAISSWFAAAATAASTSSSSKTRPDLAASFGSIAIPRATKSDARRIRQTPTTLVPDPGMSARSQTTNCSGPASISFSANAFPGSQHLPNTATRVAGFTYSVSTSPWMHFRVFSRHSRSDELAGRSLSTIPESSLPLRRAAPRCARSTKNLALRTSTNSATRVRPTPMTATVSKGQDTV